MLFIYLNKVSKLLIALLSIKLCDKSISYILSDLAIPKAIMQNNLVVISIIFSFNYFIR